MPCYCSLSLEILPLLCQDIVTIIQACYPIYQIPTAIFDLVAVVNLQPSLALDLFF